MREIYGGMDAGTISKQTGIQRQGAKAGRRKVSGNHGWQVWILSCQHCGLVSLRLGVKKLRPGFVLCRIFKLVERDPFCYSQTVA
jgi:hypothetical protein